jgi:hypothetical protein
MREFVSHAPYAPFFRGPRKFKIGFENCVAVAVRLCASAFSFWMADKIKHSDRFRAFDPRCVVILLLSPAQFFAFALLRVFGHITVEAKPLLFRWGGT